MRIIKVMIRKREWRIKSTLLIILKSDTKGV